MEWERLEISSRKLEIPRAKMGTIMDRNDMDLTEAEDIKKRWQQNTEELYKKDLHVPGASVRNSAHGKGHEEGGLAYAKV